MQNKILGVASALLIVTSALHISIYFQKGGVLEFMTASVRDSQQKTAPVVQRELTGQELYAIIKHLNKQIEAEVSSVNNETKSHGSSGLTGNASTNVAPADAGDGSGGGSGSGSTGETSGQNNSTLVQDLEAKVIGAARTEVNNVAIPKNNVSLANLLEKRKKFMIMLAEKDQHLFFLLGLSSETKNKIPKDLHSNIEIAITLVGKIEVIQIDDFQQPQNYRKLLK